MHTVVIHQPSYFPWLGLLHKIQQSDTFVVLDHVTLNRSAYQNRNQFLKLNGETHTLTIPIEKRGLLKTPIHSLTIADQYWQKKHRGFFDCNYKKHPNYSEIKNHLDEMYDHKTPKLIDVLSNSMEICFKLFKLKPNVIFSSSLNLDTNLKKDDLVIEILKQTNATDYLSGTGAKNYQDDKKFNQNGIQLHYQKFIHPQYPQKSQDKFITELSSLDAAFNLDINQRINIFK